MKNSSQALSHIRVLDMSRVLAGPWCTQNLADLGAEVIKVERPGAGDDTRGWGPPWIKDGQGRPTTDSSYYASTNRGKKSIAVNIAKPEGQALIRALAEKSDVLIENYKVGDLKRYGLDYESLAKINPGLVYCSITGYGQDGPSAHKPGYDFIFQGMGGLMSITGERDDLPGGGPQKAGVAIVDITTGMYATVAILAALNHRSVTGLGQYIDVALLDAVVALGSNQVTGHFAGGHIPRRYGNAHANLVPYQVFDVADGEIIVAAGNNLQWKRLCEAMERTDLIDDPRYRDVKDRINNRDQLVPDLARTFKTRTMADWVARIEAVDVPCGPINNYKQVFEDPQVRHRGLKVTLPRIDGGKVDTFASPLRLSRSPVRYEKAPPLVGQDTDDVLASVLEMDAAGVAALKAAGIVQGR
ncbi:MAG: CoA transferase [Burkholderiales bacterium]|nr:CoA transferase [Burkholderiales bacterium]